MCLNLIKLGTHKRETYSTLSFFIPSLFITRWDTCIFFLPFSSSDVLSLSPLFLFPRVMILAVVGSDFASQHLLWQAHLVFPTDWSCTMLVARYNLLRFIPIFTAIESDLCSTVLGQDGRLTPQSPPTTIALRPPYSCNTVEYTSKLSQYRKS